LGYLIGFAMNGLVGGTFLWLAIKLVDRRNPKNTFKAAFVASVFLGLLGMMPFLPGLGLLVLAYFLLDYYGLGIPEIMGVLFILMAMFAGVGILQMRIAGA